MKIEVKILLNFGLIRAFLILQGLRPCLCFLLLYYCNWTRFPISIQMQHTQLGWPISIHWLSRFHRSHNQSLSKHFAPFLFSCRSQEVTSALNTQFPTVRFSELVAYLMQRGSPPPHLNSSLSYY